MGALAKVFVEVAPDTSRFGPQVKRELGSINATSEGHKVGSSFVSGAKSSFGALAKVAAVSFAAIGAGAFKAGSFGLKIASQNEQAQISFETMLGSASKAQKFLGDLQKFAAKTPFEFPELQTAASSLISVGVDARKVIPIMTSLGNATAGMGTGSEGVKRATVALQQMSAAGKITGEDLNQLRDAGIPVFDLLAAATGKSKTEVAGLAQAGKLGKKELDQLFKALETGKGLERFSGLMDKQSASLAGMLSTFKDTFGQGLASAIEPALPTIKKGLQSVSDQAGHFFAALSGKGTAKDFAATTGQVALGLRAMVAAFREGDVTSDGLVGKFERLGVAARAGHLGIRALVAAFREGDVTSDGFVGAMERLGVKARAVFDYIRGTAIPAVKEWFATFRGGGTDTEKVGTAFGSIAQSLAKIGPAVQGANTSLPSFTDSLTVGSRVLAFFADHVDTLVKFMPLLVAGIVAYKAAQAAAHVAALLSVPTKIAEVLVNRQLVKSNRELIASRVTLSGAMILGTVTDGASTVATEANTVAKNAGILATVRQRVATVASAVAQKAVAAFTVAWTGAQWLLNAALTANPIGLIVVGIAALIAIIVLVATKTQFFQTVWRVAWGGIKAAFDAVYGWIKGHWPLILGILTGPIGAAVIVIVRNWDKIKSTAAALWEAIKTTFRTGAAYAVDKFLSLVGAVIHGAAKAFGWVPGLGGKLKDAAKAFDKFRDDVNRALSGVKSRNITVTAKASVLMSQGLSRGDAIATSLHRAAGGPIFGPGTGTSDSIPAMLSNGEHVLTAREVKAFGGHDAVMQMRQAAVQGFAAGGPVGFDISPRLTGMAQFSEQLERFNNRVDAIAAKLAIAAATGPTSPGLNGAVQFARSQAGKPYVWGAAGPGGYDCSGFISALVNVVQGRRPYSRRFSTGTLPAGLFAPGKGAFNIGWFRGNPGHVAATVNGVPMESRGGDGVVVGSRSRGAGYSYFTHHGHLKGFAQGGPVLPGDPPFDVLDPRGRHYKPGLLAALQNVRTYDSGGDMPPGIGVWRNNTGRTETVTPAHTMDAVVGELKALRAAFENLPVAQVDDRVIKRAANYQNIRNRSGY